MSSQNRTKNLGLCQFGDNDIPDWRTDYTGDMDKIDKSIKTISDEVAEVKKSVSDGKSKVASAITDKGVATEATDTFDTMAENIGKISSGGGKIGVSKLTAVLMPSFPYVFVVSKLTSNIYIGGNE